MNTPFISIRTYSNGKLQGCYFPSSARTVRQAAHYAREADRLAREIFPCAPHGAAIVVTARPFAYGLPTNRIVIC